MEKLFRLRRYVFIMLLCYAVWITLYLLTAWIGALRGPFFDPALPVDAAIPFIPAFFPAYLLAYVIILGLFAIDRSPAFLNRAFGTFIVMNLTAFLLFALFPAMGPARELASEGGTLSLLHAVDSRYNAFPSLHVANPWLVAFLALRSRGPTALSLLFVAVAVLISVSTLFVHQHYVLDALGGFALAVLAMTGMSRVRFGTAPW